MLDELAAEGQKLQARVAQPAPDLRELLGVPTEGKVTFSRDALGLIDGVAFDRPHGLRLAPAELLAQLNFALYAGALPGAATLAASDPLIPNRGRSLVDESGELTPPLQALMSGLGSGQQIEPTTVSNDLNTVTVSAVNGDVVSIDCASGFLESARDDVLEAEIVRIARQAAIASDVLGRYTDRSDA